LFLSGYYNIRRSPTHPTLASTLSSSFRGGGGGSSKPPLAIIAVEDGPTQKDKWLGAPIDSNWNREAVTSCKERCTLELEDWDNMLSRMASR
jgi:hypothetical protein